nr:pyruvate decarboxylase [Vibrio phage 1]
MQQHISSNISDPDLLRDLGLIGQFQLIDIAAQQDGHPAGDAILTEPNQALGATEYSYYIQLAGQQLEVAIPCNHYEAYDEIKHDLGAALPRPTEEFLQMVCEITESFFLKVKSLLVSKPESPTLAA